MSGPLRWLPDMPLNKLLVADSTQLLPGEASQIG
jgi:hypothetical protein